jgi:hypothetical protein
MSEAGLGAGTGEVTGSEHSRLFPAHFNQKTAGSERCQIINPLFLMISFQKPAIFSTNAALTSLQTHTHG